jgi:hypothetical protein
MESVYPLPLSGQAPDHSAPSLPPAAATAPEPRPRSMALLTLRSIAWDGGERGGTWDATWAAILADPRMRDRTAEQRRFARRALKGYHERGADMRRTQRR